MDSFFSLSFSTTKTGILSLFLLLLVVYMSTPGILFAKTSSNCVNTAVGNPKDKAGGCGLTGNAIADYAVQLAAAIKAHCPTVNTPVVGDAQVNSATQACIDQITAAEVSSAISPNPIQDVISWLHKSVNGPTDGGNLQCVGFVQAVAIGIGKALPSANAGEFSHQQSGYSWHAAGSAQIQTGDIPVWNTHIAIATAVHPNGWFDVVEANGGNGSVGNDSYPQSDAYGLYYLGFLRRDPSIP